MPKHHLLSSTKNYKKQYDYAEKEYILREFDNQNEPKIDRTLNRCAYGRSAFIPEMFKLGSPSPGKENDCSGVNFLIENHFPELASDAGEDNTDSCINVDAFANVSDESIEMQIQKELNAANTNQCSSLLLDPEYGNIANEIDRSNSRKRRLSQSTNYEEINEWESTREFR